VSFYYLFERGTSARLIKNLILSFAGVALVVIMYCYFFDPLEIVKFPRTDFGLAFFNFISFPVILLHRILESTHLEIPTYLGVFLGISLILATWAFIAKIGKSALKKLQKGISVAKQQTEFESEIKPSGLAEKLALFMLVLATILIQAVPLLTLQTPVGGATAYYTGVMQRNPNTPIAPDSPFAYLTLIGLGIVVAMNYPLVLSQSKMVGLVPVALQVATVITMYSLARNLTKNNKIAIVAAALTAFTISEVIYAYRDSMATPLLLTALLAYSKMLQIRKPTYALLFIALTFATLATHLIPALILLTTIISFATLQTVLTADRKSLRHFLTIITLLSLAAALITPVTQLYGWNLWTVFGSWPHDPQVSLFKLTTITRDGKDAMLFILTAIGFPYLLKTRKDEDALLLTWLLTTFILANQTLFHVYFVSIDEEVLPRFLFRLGLPLSLTAAIGVVKSAFTFSETKITVEKHNQGRPTMTIAAILIVVVLASAGLSAFIIISKFTPHATQGDYYAALWLGGYSPKNSTLETHYFQDRQVFTSLTHLFWPGTPGENVYFVQVRPKAMFQYNWNRNPVDKVYSSREDTIRFYYRENRPIWTTAPIHTCIGQRSRLSNALNDNLVGAIISIA
jgi:hypothetical protein